MQMASVTQLKTHLSRYLRAVRRGGEVQVLDRGVPIARLVGTPGATVANSGRWQRLVSTGVLRPGSGDASHVLTEPPLKLPKADLSGALAIERGDRV